MLTCCGLAALDAGGFSGPFAPTPHFLVSLSCRAHLHCRLAPPGPLGVSDWQQLACWDLFRGSGWRQTLAAAAMEEPSSTGRLTRSQARHKRPASAASKTPLKSPLLSDFYEPARKQPRTSSQGPASRSGSRPAESLRAIRKRGGCQRPPPLTGLLGKLPEEVGRCRRRTTPLQGAAGSTAATAVPTSICRSKLTCGGIVPASHWCPVLTWICVVVSGYVCSKSRPFSCSRSSAHRQTPNTTSARRAGGTRPSTAPAHKCCSAFSSLSAPQLLQQVLGYCTARELGALEATCSYFIKSGLTDRVAKHFLREIPRAKGLKPEIRCGPVWPDTQRSRWMALRAVHVATRQAGLQQRVSACHQTTC